MSVCLKALLVSAVVTAAHRLCVDKEKDNTKTMKLFLLLTVGAVVALTVWEKYAHKVEIPYVFSVMSGPESVPETFKVGYAPF